MVLKKKKALQRLSRIELLDRERGSYLKKWKGKTPIALIYPNSYKVGMSSLGLQLVYVLLNRRDDVVCERVFLSEDGQLLSIESGRRLLDFPYLFFSVSFEHDYINVVKILLQAGIEPYAEKRLADAESPVVVCGGVATFLNPEPIAPFVDLFALGEAESLLPGLVDRLLAASKDEAKKNRLYDLATTLDGVYVPSLYHVDYDASGRCSSITAVEGAPDRIKRVLLDDCHCASHSELLTQETEFSDLYLIELGRGCSRGCRFCAAGFIYRPSRLWSADTVIKGLKEKGEGVSRIGLLGMEMAAGKDLSAISQYLQQSGCSLSFSSLRADRIGESLLDLLGSSSLKSVAIAPDGTSERLRSVINKGLDENDLLDAARRLVEAGIFKIKLYVMIGLPTETAEDLRECISLVKKMKECIDPIGQQRGRLTEIFLSVNCFIPKPWTPFQYHPYGISDQLEKGESRSVKEAVANLRERISILRNGVKSIANVHFHADTPETGLFQAILARGDRRIAEILFDAASSGIPWKKAMKKRGLSPELYVTTGVGSEQFFPWYIVDHGIRQEYLFAEYSRGLKGKETAPCDTAICRRCGVCGAE